MIISGLVSWLQYGPKACNYFPLTKSKVDFDSMPLATVTGQ